MEGPRSAIWGPRRRRPEPRAPPRRNLTVNNIISSITITTNIMINKLCWGSLNYFIWFSYFEAAYGQFS